MEDVSKARHPALDAGSPHKQVLIIRRLRVKPAMTMLFLGLLRQFHNPLQ